MLNVCIIFANENGYMRLNGNPMLYTLRCSTEDKQTDNSLYVML